MRIMLPRMRKPAHLIQQILLGPLLRNKHQSRIRSSHTGANEITLGVVRIAFIVQAPGHGSCDDAARYFAYVAEAKVV